MRWSCRYSPSEMMYLEVGDADVLCYLHHSPGRADRWSFEEVLAGRHDAAVRNLFGDAAVEALKAEVRRRAR
jgi:hypothetical protein